MPGGVEVENKNGKPIRLWGIVKDKEGNIVANKPIKLMSKIKKGKRASYTIIQEGMTSKEGSYSFEVIVDRMSRYKVLVID